MSRAEQLEDNVVHAESALSEVDHSKEEAKRLAAEMMATLQETAPEALSDTATTFRSTSTKPAKKPTKPQLIESILKLQDELDEHTRQRSHYERMNKAELEEVLAFLTNKAVSRLNGDLEEAPLTHETEVSEGMRRDSPKKSLASEHGAKALFQFNWILCKFAEATSVNFQEKLGTNLQGLGDDVLANREHLEEILAQVYAEHSETLKDYISPLNQYFMLMITLGGNRAMANKSKVDELLKKK